LAGLVFNINIILIVDTNDIEDPDYPIVNQAEETPKAIPPLQEAKDDSNSDDESYMEETGDKWVTTLVQMVWLCRGATDHHVHECQTADTKTTPTSASKC
jgi:hypothetical protein